MSTFTETDTYKRRRTNLYRVNGRWEHKDGWAEIAAALTGEAVKWVLIEASMHDDQTYHLTIHESPGAAARYWLTQEQPDSWDPVCVVDLDDLKIQAGLVVQHVEFVNDNGSIKPFVTELKKFRVGCVMEFWSEDEDHATEQFYNALNNETPDANLIEEIEGASL